MFCIYISYSVGVCIPPNVACLLPLNSFVYISKSYGVAIPPNVASVLWFNVAIYIPTIIKSASRQMLITYFYMYLLIWGFPPQAPGGEAIGLKRFRNRTPKQGKCKLSHLDICIR